MICDFAEFYGVLDYRALPAKLAATLAAGLGWKSRVKNKLAGNKAIMLETALQATLIDSVNTIIWILCGGSATMDRPPSIFDILTSNTKKQEKELRSFASGAAFQDAWSKGD